MKKSFKSLTVIALGAGLLTLNACKEEVVEEPSVPICYLTQETYSDADGSDVSYYEYDSDDNLVLAVYDGDSTIFGYRNGRLVSANDKFTEATFIYGSGSTFPERINLKEGGIDYGFLIVETTNGNITKVEVHENDGTSGDLITEVSYITYDANGNIKSAQLDEWDEDTEEYITYLNIGNITTDDKTNPYSGSIAFFYLNNDNPLVLGVNNILTGDVTLAGTVLPYTSSYTYNDNDYPITSSTVFFIGSNTRTFTYNCK